MKRGEVWLVRLDPTVGSEINKTRPCVVVSPDEMNIALRTVIIAPMTTGGRDAPFRAPVSFQGRSGQVVSDHLRSVDQRRCLKKLGTLDAASLDDVLGRLTRMFEAVE